MFQEDLEYLKLKTTWKVETRKAEFLDLPQALKIEFFGALTLFFCICHASVHKKWLTIWTLGHHAITVQGFWFAHSILCNDSEEVLGSFLQVLHTVGTDVRLDRCQGRPGHLPGLASLQDVGSDRGATVIGRRLPAKGHSGALDVGENDGAFRGCRLLCGSEKNKSE